MDASLEVTWDRILQIWWAFFWRAAVVGLIGGAIAGAAAGAFSALITGTPVHSAVAGGVAGYAVSIPVSIWAVRAAFRTQYKNFQIELREKPAA